jgi:hypothetical protein
MHRSPQKQHEMTTMEKPTWDRAATWWQTEENRPRRGKTPGRLLHLPNGKEQAIELSLDSPVRGSTIKEVVEALILLPNPTGTGRDTG